MEPHRDSATDADLAPSVRNLDGAGGLTASPRASNADRDAAVTRLQDAFADGRLDDTEFDERMRAALTAKTHADLDMLLSDLPARSPGAAAPAAATRTGRGAGRPGRYAIAWKSSVRRADRWRVPERYTTVVYMRRERARPAGRRVAQRGHEQSRGRLQVRDDAAGPAGDAGGDDGVRIAQGSPDTMVLAPDAPVLHVRGLAYKGSIRPSRPPAGLSCPEPAGGRCRGARPQRRGPGVLIRRDPAGRGSQGRSPPRHRRTCPTLPGERCDRRS